MSLIGSSPSDESAAGTTGTVTVLKEGNLGWIVFDHLERRNAISLRMWQQIPDAVRVLAADDQIRVVVLRGAGDAAFVSGADISEFEAARSGGAVEEYEEVSGRAFDALSNLDKPLLALIHGFCVGGGVAIALLADMRYASDDAVFAIPAARLGLGYHVSGIEALTNVVGFSRAKEIFFTARRFRADEALQMGLVNAVVPKSELDAHVRATAAIIAANAPLTVKSVKIITRELTKESNERRAEAVLQSIAACYASEDYAEGVRAFLDKRRPVFRGR
jgi:enoyl-CoA hydratase